jgi:hypothetical protein
MTRRRQVRGGKERRAVAHSRVITEGQHLGPDAQRSPIESWAGARGLEVVSWREELGGCGAAELAPESLLSRGCGLFGPQPVANTLRADA